MTDSALRAVNGQSLADARRRLVEQRLRGQSISGEPAVRALPANARIPLSDAQRGIWFLTQVAPESPLFNECFTVLLPADVHLPTLVASLDAIVARHAIWRTTIEVVDGEPRQVVHASGPFDITTIDLRGRPQPARSAGAQRQASEHAARPFDLARGPLVRGLLVSLADTEHKLFITAHHLVIDSVTCYGVFLEELATIYDALRRGQPSPLAPLAVQYGDYAHWRLQRVREPQVDAQLSYWKERLAGAPEDLAVPADRPRPTLRTYRGGRQQTVIDADLSDRLRALASREGTTLFSVLLAILVALLHRLSGQDDIVVGVPVTTPKPSSCDALIGSFANMVAIRVDASGNPSLLTLLRRVREAMIDAVDHADAPFDRVVEVSRPRYLNRAALFQTLLTLQAAPPASAEALGFGILPLEADCGGCKVDFAFLVDERRVAREGPSCLGVTLQYSLDLFDPPTMARRLDEFVTLAKHGVENSERPLSAITCVSVAERRRVVEQWNDTAVPYPDDTPIEELFRAQAQRCPNAIAVEESTEQITYRELDLRAERLAGELRQHGAGPGTPVAVLLDRSIGLVTSLLAILKAGGIYVPLDPQSPRDRLRAIIADARPIVLIPDGARLDLASTLHTTILRVDVDGVDTRSRQPLRPSRVGPRNGRTPACVLYTSGSTGEPKGVIITHRGLARLVINTDYVAIRRGDRVAHLANVCFDATSFEIWGALLSGATLVVFPHDCVASPRALSDTLASRRITTAFITSALFNEVVRVSPSTFAGMHDVLFGGERVDPQAVRAVLDAAPPQRLLNGYGPTETTTFASWHLVSRDDLGGQGIPIGKPIANTTIYILDQHLEPVPVGVVGEICIGGDGVADGYLQRPELTAVRFIDDPFSDRPGARLYRSGDLGRFRADGTIEFLGRLDDQVKIRGHRIEPGEVEATLRTHPAVAEAVVYAGQSTAGEHLLAAHVRMHVGALLQDAPSALRAYLKLKLPEYMIPSVIAVVDEWPKTPSGKIDRQAITAAPIVAMAVRERVVARDRLEEELIRLWSEVLGVSPIGVGDNFFDLGGHSLLAAKMIDEVGRLCGKHLRLGGFFANPTIESLAQAVNAEGTSEMPAIVTLRRDGAKAPLFFVHGDFNGRGLYCRHLIDAVDADRPFHVVHPHGIDGRRIPTTIEAMAAQRLATVCDLQPHGPYVIGGYCNGALVAFAMAHALRARGEAVERLILVDPPSIGVGFAGLKRALTTVGAWATGDPLRAMAWMYRLVEFAEQPAARQVRTVWNKLRRVSTNEAPSDRDVDPTRDYSVVIRTYVPHPYDGAVSLVASETEAERLAAWKRWCSRTELTVTEGTHQNCTTTFVHALAERLGRALESCR